MSNAPEQTPEQLLDILSQHAQALREHFSSVHIVAVTLPDRDDDSVGMHVGVGSFYERLGILTDTVQSMRNGITNEEREC